ncbi:MAG: 5'-nucleotidase C-terminal domain-containing protein [Prolixibacteraceae bacterium]|jgi:2',3'-cyclic-nucleotide 2'-phosphodiesterase (5'-nucleotidase family)|nr:5'-nucleotidase C-terminal domain-containing protein [Prolixibacteraceae bacterium]
MNIRLLISIIAAFLLVSCGTLTQTATYDYKNLPISDVSDSISDQNFDDILKPYKNEIEEKLSEFIAKSNNGMASYRPESPLSNFLTDLILSSAKQYSIDNNLNIKPEIALFNHGGIRASVPKGEITIRNAYEIMPFENELVMVLLTGEQIISLADYIATRKGEGVAGITFGMMADKAIDIKVQGVKVDKNKQYWLVTNDYIANGGDGMKVLTWASERIDTGLKIRDVIIDGFTTMNENGKTIDAKTDGRIYYVE